MMCCNPARYADLVVVPLEKSTCTKSSSEHKPSDLRYGQIWKIIPSVTPKIIKRCSRCHSSRFSSSDKFRVNANKKLIDAWLIYKCDDCDATLKVSIINRSPVAKIGQEFLDKLQGNDRHLAWYYAFTVCQQKKELEIDWDINFNIIARMEEVKESGMMENKFTTILIVSDFFLKIPIFSILRQKWGCSRSQIDKLYAKRGLEVYNIQGQALKLKASIGVGCFLKVIGIEEQYKIEGATLRCLAYD